MSSGAAKSGKPWERFTAPCLSASRVISRMTDSVKRLAFCETCRCLDKAGVVIAFLIGSHFCDQVPGCAISPQPIPGSPAPARPSRARRACREAADIRAEFLVQQTGSRVRDYY